MVQKKTILERLIIINAISSKGWLRGAKRLFQANKKTEDYHAQMNTGYFKNGLVKNSYTE